MNDIANRTLLIASYCVMSTNMAIEVIAHPDAKDHGGSIVGLGFCLLILIALIRRISPKLAVAAATLSGLIAVVGAYLIIRFVILQGVGSATAPDLIVKVYFSIVVPVFAARYIVLRDRAIRAASSDAQQSVRAIAGPRLR
jgi:hypothetical protein